jgi:hypothetical protein
MMPVLGALDPPIRAARHGRRAGPCHSRCRCAGHPLAHAVQCMADGLDIRAAALETKLAEVSDTLADNAKRMAELKVRLTELAGIAAGQAMSIEEKLNEVLRRLPPPPQ